VTLLVTQVNSVAGDFHTGIQSFKRKLRRVKMQKYVGEENANDEMIKVLSIRE